MTRHETYREWLALRLYDELEGAQAERLAAHLEDCAGCAAFALELERGLGRARAALEAEDFALPGDWRAALLESRGEPAVAAGPSPAPAAWRGWATLAAGFVLGLLATRALAPDRPEPGRTRSPQVAEGAGETAVVPLDQPPPLARTTSRFARVRPYLGR